MTDYGGESNAKKLARVLLWDHLQHVHVASHGRILVLAGPEAGDIRTLQALGIDPRNIVAVDTDPEHIAKSREIAPDAEYILGDVFEAVREFDRDTFDVMFFDFCSTVSRDTLLSCLRAAKHGLKDFGLLAIGNMYGRESAETKKILRRELAHAKRKGIGTKINAGTKRARFTWQQLGQITYGTRMMVVPTCFMT